jgi:hypothetical protein
MGDIIESAGEPDSPIGITIRRIVAGVTPRSINTVVWE